MVDVFYDAYSVLGKVYSDGAYLKQALLTTPVEPLNKAKTVKICYGVLDKDIYLEYCIGCLCERAPKQKIKILLKIAMYAERFLEKKDFVVTNSVVELAKKLGKGGSSGFINAVMRKFKNSEIPLPKDGLKRLSVEYSYPEYAVSKLVSAYGKQTAKDIMAYDEDRTFVRFLDGVNGSAYLKERGYSFEETPFDNLFAVEKISRNDDFDNGLFTFQSIGSVAICAAFDGGKKLLDACAAPGGKSVLLSSKYDSVVACELHEHRAELIKAYAFRMGVKNVNVRVKDSSVRSGEFLSAFDAVLCDVPCSGFGTVKSNPDVKLNRSESSLKEIVKIQDKILKNCADYVSRNGVLVYSTCSIFPEENDKVVERFLQNDDRFSVEKYSSPLPAIETDHGKIYLPHISMGAGFYCAKLRRVK